MVVSGSLLLVGCGKMGSALLSGWLKQGISAEQITVVEPGIASGAVAVPDGVRVVATVQELPADLAAQVVVLAVKPQVLPGLLPGYQRFVGSAVFLSIAAGQTLGGMSSILAGGAVVRAMPNTPAAVGSGISALYANEQVSDAQRAVCQGLLEAVGDVVWLGDESQMDAVTGVSGSGPAYVFLLVEALAAAGVVQGLDTDLAMKLARKTVAGSGLLLNGSVVDAAELRRNVTSPAGTTAAALDVLMADGGLATLMARAVDAATRRSRELAS